MVNAHAHSNENWFRGLWDNLPLEPWMLFSYPVLAAPTQSADEIYVRTLLGGMEMLRIMLGKKSAGDFSRLVSSLSCVKGATDGMNLPPGLKSSSAALAAAGNNLLNPRIADWYPSLEKEKIGGALGEMMAGRMTPDEAISAIQKAADEVAKDDSVTKYKHT